MCLFLIIETFEKYMQKCDNLRLREKQSPISSGLRLIGASFVHSIFTDTNCKSRKHILIYIMTVSRHRAISNHAVCSIGRVILVVSISGRHSEKLIEVRDPVKCEIRTTEISSKALNSLMKRL